jgi:hypothetical protein
MASPGRPFVLGILYGVLAAAAFAGAVPLSL